METSEDDRFSYNTAALARLVLSGELHELADLAGALVPTGSDKHGHRPGEIVEAARRIADLAQSVVARAVVYERERGTSWDRIGEVFDISRQSAHTRYSGDVTEWKEALLEPFYEQDEPVRNLRLPEPAFRPTDAKHRLDRWATEHAYARGEDQAVSAGLPELSLIAELNQVLEALAHLYRNPFERIDQDKRARLLDRKAALLDRIAVEDNRPEAAQQAAEARALASQLRGGRHLRAVAEE